MSITRSLSKAIRHLPVKRAVKLTMFVWASLFVVSYVRFLTVPEPLLPEPCAPEDADFINATERNLVERLAQAIRFKTVSYSKNHTDLEEVSKLIKYIEESFPLIHSSPLVKRELVNSHSLLYTVSGSDPSLKPYLLVAHLDVVPAEEHEWDVNPFAGQVKDGKLYGRGTIDVKNILMGTLEALEYALENGFQPQRTFYLAFGHDEEVSGFQGAANIAKLLESRNVELEFLLDEGLLVIKDIVPGISEPVAVIGVAEKGYLTLKLTVNTTGGHSSLTPKETAIVILANALSKLQGDVHESQFGKGPECDMLERAAPYARGMFKYVYSNIWLFSPIIQWMFNKNPATSANIRTTTAVTMVGGGIKENVIPTSAWAIINHRVFPSQSIEEVIQFNKETIGDPRIKMEVITAHEPVKSSPYGDDNYAWRILEKTIQQIYPTSPVLPSLMPARTDSSWYTKLTSNIYRFTPVSMHVSESKMFHGRNEHIRVENYEQVVNFFYHLIQNTNSKSSQCSSVRENHQEL